MLVRVEDLLVEDVRVPPAVPVAPPTRCDGCGMPMRADQTICTRCGFNKALIYRYYVDKPGLFDAALQSLFENRTLLETRQPKDLGESLYFWFQQTLEDPQFVRLLLRESLNDTGGEVVEEAQRRGAYRKHVENLAESQAEGEIDPAFDRETLLLALAALSLFPAVFPQLTRLMTDSAVDSPAFARRWKKLLGQMADALRPRTKTSKK